MLKSKPENLLSLSNAEYSNLKSVPRLKNTFYISFT